MILRSIGLRFALIAFAPGLGAASPDLFPASADVSGSTSVALHVVHVETITVRPENEGLDPPAKSRWQKFEEALGPGRTAQARYGTYGWRRNDGSRFECYSPCYLNCCEESGGFSLLGAGFGGK